MSNYYYQKSNQNIKRILRFTSLIISLSGLVALLYVFFPILSWQFYFAPVFASQDIAAPIPKTTIVSQDTIASLLSEAKNSLTQVDYSNALNWFPQQKPSQVSAKIL